MGTKKNPSSGSIFSQDLDRAIFVMYFLGAIMPLIALGVSMQRFVLPALTDDPTMTKTMLGVLLGVSALTLIAFFALRILARRAIEQMNADNARLQGILFASKDLSTSFHVKDVAEITARCAQSMTEGEIILILTRAKEEEPYTLLTSLGEGAQDLFDAHVDLVHDLVENCIANESVTILASSALSDAKKSGSSRTIQSGLAFPLLMEDGSSGAVVALNGAKMSEGFADAEKDALTTLSTLTGVALKNVTLQDAQRNFFAHITDLLVAAMDAHVDDRKGHAMAVAQLSNRLARELEIPEEKMQQLHFAALLHDIGMLRIPAADQASLGHFQKHPQMAYRMLSRIRHWEGVAPIVHHHHEWFDGSGYPEAISGEEIPLESRIIAVADVYDALLRPSNRRQAMSIDEAIAEISNCAGTQFDPRVTEALKRLAETGNLPDTPD